MNNDGIIEIIHGTIGGGVSPLLNRYTVFNYSNNTLEEVSSFSIYAFIPDEVYVKDNIVKFEYWPAEAPDNYRQEEIFNLNSRTELIENVDYFVEGEFTGTSFDITKRGYYINTLNYYNYNTPYYYIICMGQQNTGGYRLEIKEVNINNGKTEIIVEEITPHEGATVTMGLTEPTIVVKFLKYQDNIIIKNTEGEEFVSLIG